MAEAGVRSGGRERSYADLHERTARIARGLADLGVGPGDRVALVLRNEPVFLEAGRAARLLGAAPVPVNWHSGATELRHVLADSDARVVFVHADLTAAVQAVLADPVEVVEVRVPAEVATAYGLSAGRAAPSGRHRELESWLRDFEPWDEPQPPAPGSMIYTSGTTGLPKGIVRAATTPEQDDVIARLLAGAFALRPPMRTLVPAPLYHSAPNAHAGLAVTLGMPLTLMPRFDPEELLRLVEAQRIEHIQMVPTMFTRLLRLPADTRARYDLSSLQAVVHAAAPCPPDVKRAMIDWWGPIIHEYYGATEVGICVTCDSAQWLAHPGTVGAPIAGVALRILDAAGAQLGPGETGEVFIRPAPDWPDFGYANDQAKRTAMERDGFLTQGDVGHLDADGFLYLSDRATDMVISGGVNIYPAEIEQCLHGLDGVRDVAVVGIPDEEYGEALAAHVDADPEAGLTQDDVRAHVRRHLAGYKVPRVVVFDDALPREDTGKLFKRRIRDRYWP